MAIGRSFWQLFRLRLSSQGQISGKSELVTSGTGRLGYGLEFRKMARSSTQPKPLQSQSTRFRLTTADRNQAPLFNFRFSKELTTVLLRFPEDGRWLAYDAVGAGESSFHLAEGPKQWCGPAS